MSRAPANHDDIDEGAPQLLAQVNAASAPSSHGQVPQTGWGSVQEEAEELKALGSEVIKLTHQSLRSWLKLVAPKNMNCISVTLLVSQLPIC